MLKNIIILTSEGNCMLVTSGIKKLGEYNVYADGLNFCHLANMQISFKLIIGSNSVFFLEGMS